MKEKIIALLFTVLPHHLISRFVGFFAHTKIKWIKNTFIHGYIRFFKVDMSESKIKNVADFDNFNAFFTRELLDGAREQDLSPNSLMCPVDGAVSELGAIEKNKLLQAKGEYYTLEALLGDTLYASRFNNGKFNTLYLAPKDYHRIHMPITGKLKRMVYVPGRLFSVNPLSARAIPGLFARNERVIAYFETEIGLMAMVLVGAMIVASIATQWAGVVVPNKNRGVQSWAYERDNIVLEKGAEMGHFQLGSTVILLFEKSAVHWQENLTSNSAVKMGQLLATYHATLLDAT